MFVGVLEGLRFPPCFSWIYAALRPSVFCALKDPEWPWGARHPSPEPVPKVLSFNASADGCVVGFSWMWFRRLLIPSTVAMAAADGL